MSSAREHVKVVLTGQGADEPFGGYPRHLAERYGWAYRRLPSSLGVRLLPSLVEALPRNERLKRAVRSVSISDEIERLVKVYTVLDEELQHELVRGGWAGDGAIEHAVSLWHADAAKLDPVGKMMYVDARFSLADNLLLLADKLSMAVSLEARVPFLDVEAYGDRGKNSGIDEDLGPEPEAHPEAGGREVASRRDPAAQEDRLLYSGRRLVAPRSQWRGEGEVARRGVGVPIVLPTRSCGAHASGT